MSQHITHKLNRPGEGKLTKFVLILVALVFLGVFLVLPLITVFYQAFKFGIQPYLSYLSDPMTISAIQITLISATTAVILNTIFGIAAAWLISKFEFPGKKIILTLIDLPLTISPVIIGIIFVFLVGVHGYWGEFFASKGIKIIFAVPGIVLATTFVTFSFVARELIPHMQGQGNEEEEAAILLGASGFKTFFLITLPKIKWSLLYGIILCNARACGEFGAVSVVSGHIRGLTNTLSLHIEILYNEYNIVAAFAVASILTVLALITLIVKKLMEYSESRDLEALEPAIAEVKP